MFVAITLAAIGAAALRFGIQYEYDLREFAKSLRDLSLEEASPAFDATGRRTWVPIVCYVCAGGAIGAAVGLLIHRKRLCITLGVLIAFVATFIWSILSVWLIR